MITGLSGGAEIGGNSTTTGIGAASEARAPGRQRESEDGDWSKAGRCSTNPRGALVHAALPGDQQRHKLVRLGTAPLEGLEDAAHGDLTG